MEASMERVQSSLQSKSQLKDPVKDVRKICITNLKGEKDDYVLEICEMFGAVDKFRRAQPNLAFISFTSEW